MDLEKLKHLIARHESERAELKEWKDSIPFDGANDWKNRRCLIGYCVAIGNEGGGYILVGVDNQKNIVGTSAPIPNAKTVFDRTGQKINVHEVYDEAQHRILVIDIPSRGIGQLFKFAGVPLMRVNDSLEIMSDAEQRRILLEGVDDFSARLCDVASLSSIDREALKTLRDFYTQKNPGNQTDMLSDEQFLSDLALMRNGKLTYAGVILLATESFLQMHLSDAEICFEYRNSKDSPTYNERKDYRKAFVLLASEIWEKIYSRQQVHTFVDGLFRREIPAYNEEVMREALFNAVCHRDYAIRGSIFIKQSSEEIEITSPGGFINGITSENIISAPSTPRNRLLAEVFQKIFSGVERSGQGADKIFRLTISDGKGTPEYVKNDFHFVVLKIPAILQDANFVKYLEKVTNEGQFMLTIDDIVLLEKIRVGNNSGITLKTIGHLVERGFIDAHGQTRGTIYVLAKQYYEETGRLGERTRRIGLSRDARKELILEHLRKNQEGTMGEFMQIFPELKRSDINNLLAELKNDHKILKEGERRWARWRIYT